MKSEYRNVGHFSMVVGEHLCTLGMDDIYVGAEIRAVKVYPSTMHAPYRIRMIGYCSKVYHTISKDTQRIIIASNLFDSDLFYMYVANLHMDSEKALVACLS